MILDSILYKIISEITIYLWKNININDINQILVILNLLLYCYFLFFKLILNLKIY